MLLTKKRVLGEKISNGKVLPLSTELSGQKTDNEVSLSLKTFFCYGERGEERLIPLIPLKIKAKIIEGFLKGKKGLIYEEKPFPLPALLKTVS